MTEHSERSRKTMKLQSARALTIGLALLATVHVVASWGHITLFWGDYGKWLHEVERIGAGARIYSDVYWPYPPGAGWLFGLWARLVGSDLVPIWTGTILLFAGTTAAFAAFAWRVTPPAVRLPLTLVIAWLAWSIAFIESAPLPQGMYTPAASVGGTLLIASVLVSLKLLDGGRPVAFLGLGMLLSATVLMKVDFWPPSGFLLVALFIMSMRARDRSAQSNAVALLAGAAIVGLGGIGFLVWQSGWRAVPGAATGFGLAQVMAFRALPTGELLVIEAASAALVLCAVCGSLWWGTRSPRAARATIALGVLAFVGALAWFAGSAFKPEDAGAEPPRTVGEFLLFVRVHRLEFLRIATAHAIPLLIPVLALAYAWRARARISNERTRRILLLLLGAIVAARLRRLFQHVDWYHILLELPTYALLLDALIPGEARVRERVLRGLCVLIGLYAAVAYWSLGRGAFTQRGWQAGLVTTRGTIHVQESERETYLTLQAALDSIDPSRERPLFAFGYQGGFNYFFDRRNPTMLTQGFYFAALSTVAREREKIERASPPVILLDNPFLEPYPPSRPSAPASFWRGKRRTEWFETLERPIFDQMKSRCRLVTPEPAPGRLAFAVFDCRSDSFR